MSRQTRISRDRKRRRLRQVVERFNGRCVYCGTETVKGAGSGQVTQPNAATLDHFIPRSLGGQECIWNYVLACRACNEEKGDRMPGDFEIEVIGMMMELFPSKIAS